MNTPAERRNSVMALVVSPLSYIVLSLTLALTACNSSHYDQTYRYAEAKFRLESANFKTGVTHATGEASCLYMLFSIPLCRDQNLATVAWNKMRTEAQIEGKSAQLVNVFEDQALRWNLFYLVYMEHYSVSADVIVYSIPEPKQESSYFLSPENPQLPLN